MGIKHPSNYVSFFFFFFPYFCRISNSPPLFSVFFLYVKTNTSVMIISVLTKTIGWSSTQTLAIGRGFDLSHVSKIRHNLRMMDLKWGRKGGNQDAWAWGCRRPEAKSLKRKAFAFGFTQPGCEAVGSASAYEPKKVVGFSISFHWYFHVLVFSCFLSSPLDSLHFVSMRL